MASAEGAGVRLLCAAAAVAAAVAGCSGTVEPRTPDEVRSITRERAFLLSPLEGYPLVVAPARQEALAAAWETLVEGRRAEAAALRAAELLAATPGLHPAIVILAQAELVTGDYEAAKTRLRPVLEELPDYSAAALVAARASEQLEEIPEAYEAYRRLGAEYGVARDRATALENRAVEIVGRRLESSLDRGHLEAARTELERLEEWAPRETVTLRSRRRMAAAEGDARAELAVVRELRRRLPEDRDLRLREADLELEIGDAGVGLRILQEMVEATPDDAELVEALGRARFRWRLQLLPPASRQVMRRPQLNRAEFAQLLYGLFPSVRYGGVRSGGTIANDVFDHPARDEIVKVINQGLMQVDRNLHTFQPERPLQRGEALRTLLELLLQQQPRLACAAGVGRGDLGRSARTVCRVASSCELTEESACLPEAPVSGAEAVEMARRTLEQLGAD